MKGAQLFILLLLNLRFFSSSAQVTDTILSRTLPKITIEGNAPRHAMQRLDPISGTYIFAGKKNEVISLQHIDANITEKTSRQIFAKVPGIFVYDMEGGNQMNISARGLDPHRGWEFNLRKDGIIINSDIYAYPASHYSIPMESVERIELVRGTGSLQYGAQFGGMLNYVSKQGDTSRPFGFETYNTIGSYNLLSTYNAISGKIGKTKYYAYFSKRSRDGYRKNEHTDYDAEGIALTYEHSEKLSLRFEWARSNYTYRLPGPLTDSMFYADPTQASRGRNYFNPAINIPSFTLKWDIQKNTRIQYVSSAVIGVRNSILFDKPANNYDTLLASTREYAYRQIDIDRFNSFTHELRLLQGYSLGQNQSHLSLGLQFMHNELHRTQVGKGSTGSDFNLNLVDPIWGRDMYFNTKNLALFAENNFSVLKNLSINIGARVEMGESNMKGKIIYYPENAIPVSIAHRFPLFGTSIDYKPTEQINLYGGFSQSYRPMLFKDIVPGSLFEKIDPNIRDADGYNAELGFRGKFLFLQWDITGFLLQYNNRFGTLALTDSLGNFYTYKTNIGNSLTKGLEIFLQANWTLPYKNQISIFTSTSIMDGRYSDGKLKLGNTNVDISGNKIESVPDIISRNGMTYQYSKLSITLLYSYTSSTYADALNTALPNPSGSVGLVPSYGIVDMNLTYRVSKSLEFKTSINNLTNEQYFTKRPMFYPGPGVWSSDGANGSFSIILRL